MIKCADPKTYPEEIELVVTKFITQLHTDVKTDFVNRHITRDDHVFEYVREFCAPYSDDYVCAQIIPILETYEIQLFHSTRLLGTMCIEKHGLKVNEWAWYQEVLTDALQKLGLTSEITEQAMKFVRKTYDHKCESMENPSLYFYSSSKMANKAEHNGLGYAVFSESIGGEIADWALKENMPEVYSLLQENGTAFIVEASVPFSYILDCLKGRIAYQFVCYYIAKIFWDYEYPIEFTSVTTKSIARNHIVHIIPYFDKNT